MTRNPSHRESRGEAYLRAQRLPEAERAFVEDGSFGCALDVALLQADIEEEPKKRLAHLLRAKQLATAGTDAAGRREVELRYHRTRRALAEASPAGSMQRSELGEIGRSFEVLGALDEAAQAFRAAADHASLARVLGAAGDVDGLEEALSGQQAAERAQRAIEEARAAAHHAVATGQREAALASLTAVLRAGPNAELGRLRAAIEEARAARRGTRLIDARSIARTCVFGDTVVIGRSETAEIPVASPVVSRRHLVLRAGSDGVPRVTIEGRGTLLGGALVAGELSVNGHLELLLGAVPVTLDRDEGAGVFVTIAGEQHRYWAPLGPLVIGPFVITPTGDGLRLVSSSPASHPYLDGLTACPEGIDLARGDRVSAERGGPSLVTVAR